MIIESVSEVSASGLYRIRFEKGAVCYARQQYLSSIILENLCAGQKISEDNVNELTEASLTVAVELKANEYLARAEQSRFGLTQKLQKKQFGLQYIKKALDYLEEKKYLDDLRYSTAWLNTRKINHYEGRIRLLAELKNRGISEKNASDAVKDFFEYNDEYEICKKAYEKFLKSGLEEDKIIQKMNKAGFSYKLQQQIKEDLNERINQMAEMPPFDLT